MDSFHMSVRDILKSACWFHVDESAGLEKNSRKHLHHDNNNNNNIHIILYIIIIIHIGTV